MELEQKKKILMECIKLGMAFYESALVAECTEEEIEQLEEDKQFQHTVKVRQAIEEEQLLRKHNTGLEIAKAKGNTKPIEWRLAKLNSKYETSSKIKIDDKKPINMNINLKGKHPENANNESGN